MIKGEPTALLELIALLLASAAVSCAVKVQELAQARSVLPSIYRFGLGMFGALWPRKQKQKQSFLQIFL